MASRPLASDADAPIYRGHLPARIVTFNGTSDCTLIDLSCTGAKIAAQDCPRVGSMVIIESLPMELFGTVRWSRRGLFGFEFDRAMTQQEVIAMRHYADGEAARQKEAQMVYARNWVQGIRQSAY